MRLPWTNRETRDAVDYTDAVLSALLTAAGGAGTDDAGLFSVTAVIEACAGQWARAFAMATVEPQTRATEALTPDVLAHLGRELLERGEALLEIVVEDGRAMLVPASSWTVYGRGGRRDTWTYEANFPGPTMTYTKRLPADQVIHCQYAFDSVSPWRGMGPLQKSHTTVSLLGRLEKRLSEEVNQPIGAVLAVPNVKASAELQADLRKLKGQLTLVQSTAGGWEAGKAQAPTSDWQPRRLGADPPQTLEPLRDAVSRSILAAAGVPVSILGNSDGTLAREAFRQFLHATIAPVGEIVAVALGEGLAAEGLTFSWNKLFASDLSGRARAFQSMVKGGMDVDKAAALAGLMSDDNA